MPTSYNTTVTVAGYGSADYGSMLDSLQIVSGSVLPYELPQPASAKAGFLGLPVVSGVTQTPDWWLGKEVTFTITPQGVGVGDYVQWTGIVQGYDCSAVNHDATTQLVELDLLSPKISTQLLQSQFIGSYPIDNWANLTALLDSEIAKLTWAEAPAGLTWAAVTTTWADYTNDFTGITFDWDTLTASTLMYQIPSAGRDILSFITDVMSSKYKGWMWFNNATVSLNAPSSYTNYSLVTSLDAKTCVLWSSLNASQNLNNVINNAGIYDAATATTATYLDSTSYAQYGDRYIDLNPSYEGSSTIAPLIVQDKINAYKQPNKYLQSLTLDLDKFTHTAGEWQNFYISGKPVRLPLTNIPTAYGGDHTYMIRGVTLNLTNKHAETSLVVVPSTIYNPS
jgi:hypothetical protein